MLSEQEGTRQSDVVDLSNGSFNYSITQKLKISPENILIRLFNSLKSDSKHTRI